MSFAIITDSTSDMNATLREQHNIDYVMMNYVLDGEEDGLYLPPYMVKK